MGKKQGKGRFEYLYNKSVYEGDFHNNMISGSGTYHYSDGRTYTGEWLNDKMHGEGRFHWPDDRLYEGSYVHDKK